MLALNRSHNSSAIIFSINYPHLSIAMSDYQLFVLENPLLGNLIYAPRLFLLTP